MGNYSAIPSWFSVQSMMNFLGPHIILRHQSADVSDEGSLSISTTFTGSISSSLSMICAKSQLHNGGTSAVTQKNLSSAPIDCNSIKNQDIKNIVSTA